MVQSKNKPTTYPQLQSMTPVDEIIEIAQRVQKEVGSDRFNVVFAAVLKFTYPHIFE